MAGRGLAGGGLIVVAGQRIQKVLSAAGVASRRAIEEMIGEGRITVNGQLLIDLPCFIDPATDVVTVDGNKVTLTGGQARYILLNKPKDVVCTSRDERGRKRAADCIPAMSQRVYCVGRLDADSTGLVLLTNDGALTQHLTHPSHGVVKTYRVQIAGRLTGEQVDRFKRGVWLDGRRTTSAGLRVLRRHATGSLLEIRLAEGRNREIRRVLLRLGHKVKRLHRCAIGPVTDKGLGIGSWRELSANEVDQLRRTGGSATRPGRSGKAPSKKPSGRSAPRKPRRKSGTSARRRR